MRWRHFRRYGYRAKRALTSVSAGRVQWSRGTGVLFGGLIGVGLAFLFIHFINIQLRPVMAELAAAQVRNEVTLVIDNVVAQGVAKGHITYDGIIQLDKDDAGKVTALRSDMAQVNILRSDILNALVDAVGQVDSRALGIPIGNLTGVDLLSGRGPEISVKVLTAGTADAAFQNAFSSAGINQTRHQIMLDVTVPVSILMPGYTAQTSVSAQVCVAETVIVGSVPDNYTYFSQFDSTKEAADHYFDYGAGQ